MLFRRVLIYSAVVFLFLFSQSSIAGADIVKETIASKNPALLVFEDKAAVNWDDDAVLKTEGSSSAGASVSGAGSILTLKAAEITTEGYDSHGVVVGGAGSSVGFGDKANIATSGAVSYGAYASGEGSSITFDGNTSVATDGGQSYGAAIDGNASWMAFNKTTSITTGGVFAYGAVVDGDGSVMRFDGETAVKTTGTLSSGAVVGGGGSSIQFNSKTDVATENGGAYGAIVSGDGSSIKFAAEANLTTGGANASGVAVTGKGSGISIGGEANIATGGISSHGAYVTGNGSNVSINGAATIVTGGLGAHGAYINAADSKIDFDSTAAIATGGKLAHGAYANGTTSKISFKDSAVITTTGEKAHGAYTLNASSGIEFMNGAEIAVSGVDAYALFAVRGSISSSQSGKYMISGDMVTDTGTVNLDMAAGSLFAGKTSAGNGDISLSMTDSRWNVAGNSNLTTLNLDSTLVDYSGAANGTTITTDTLGGAGGTFLMKTDIVKETGDKLVITDTMNGSEHKIFVLNDGSAATMGNEIVTLVDTADSTGSFALTNNVELGAWQYGLRQEAGGLGSEWQLHARGLSSTGDAVINTIYAAYLLNYAETQTLIQRLGDLRATPRLSGFWFRAHGGSFEFKPDIAVNSFDMDYWGVQLGYDRKIEISWDGDVYAGVMFGYGKGDFDDVYGGSGEIDSKTIGVYGTFIHENGFFADLVLKYQWTDGDFDTIDSTGARVSGSGASSNGFGASLELGQRIPFAAKQKAGWYVEPQAQLTGSRLGGEQVVASNGLRVEANNYTSVQGRLGMLIGYETEDSNFYAKASKVKEFSGDLTVLANSQILDISFGGSWWVYGLGFTSRLDAGSSVYFDLERASGGLFTQEWAVKAGWRLSF